MRTIVIQIGNSDDKLPQARWAAFVADVATHVAALAHATHFHGLSPGDARWQNACWVCEVQPKVERELKRGLRDLAAVYGQESIAYTRGATEFLGGGRHEATRA